MILVKKCVVCGTEFEAVGKQKYCSKECRNHYWNRHKRKRSRRGKPRDQHHTDAPIPYNSEQAQAAHDRQAEIERRARAAGQSYGKYQMMKYLEANG